MDRLHESIAEATKEVAFDWMTMMRVYLLLMGMVALVFILNWMLKLVKVKSETEEPPATERMSVRNRITDHYNEPN